MFRVNKPFAILTQTEDYNQNASIKSSDVSKTPQEFDVIICVYIHITYFDNM